MHLVPGTSGLLRPGDICHCSSLRSPLLSQIDLQAQDRAHRIGQKKPVTVFHPHGRSDQHCWQVEASTCPLAVNLHPPPLIYACHIYSECCCHISPNVLNCQFPRYLIRKLWVAISSISAVFGFQPGVWGSSTKFPWALGRGGLFTDRGAAVVCVGGHHRGEGVPAGGQEAVPGCGGDPAGPAAGAEQGPQQGRPARHGALGGRAGRAGECGGWGLGHIRSQRTVPTSARNKPGPRPPSPGAPLALLSTSPHA